MDALTTTSSPKGLKGFIARRGLACTIITVLFILLVAANAVYALWEASYNPSFCSICHIIRPYVQSYNGSEYLDHIHAQAGVGCKECHVTTPIGALKEVAAYVTGNYHNPLPEKRVDMQVCLKCHRSYASLAEQTKYLPKNPHDGHWPNLQCSMCHKSHRETVNYCVQCHDPMDFLFEAGEETRSTSG